MDDEESPSVERHPSRPQTDSMLHSFQVVDKWGTVHTYSSAPGIAILSPNNTLRRFSIHLQTSWLFSAAILFTIVVNSIGLLNTQSYEIIQSIDSTYKTTWLQDTFYLIDYICLSVYCVELLVKILAKGLIGNEHSCYRDPWFWLDVVVIFTGFVPFNTLLLDRRSFEWLRVFKIIPIVPGIRKSWQLSVKCVKELQGLVTLLVVLFWFFGLLAMQFYMGTLSQKCIKEYPAGIPKSHELWTKYNSNHSNLASSFYGLCGNSTYARQCPDGYVCLQGFGDNPDYGYTNFDNILWSLVSVVRIAGEDFTEELFRQILGANGTYHNLFFLAIFVLITFPMGSFFFATLGYVYSEKVSSGDGSESSSGCDAQQSSPTVTDTELVGWRKTLFSVMFNSWTRVFTVIVIIFDVNAILWDCHAFYVAHGEDHYQIVKIVPYITFVLYLAEFLVKSSVLGPSKYFRDKWNILDLLVLLTFLFEAKSYLTPGRTGYLIAPIRFLKLAQYWPGLQTVLKIYGRAIKALWGWMVYSCILFAFIVVTGAFEIGTYEIENLKAASNFTVNDIPRYSFITFWHSFRVVVRMQIAEWVETLWEILPHAGNRALIYYLVANLCGAVLISMLLIGIVYCSLDELKASGNHSQDYERFQRSRSKEGILQDLDEDGDDSQTIVQPNEMGLEPGKLVTTETSTGPLQNKLQNCMEHWAYTLTCSAIIIVASVAMIWETAETENDIQLVLHLIEVIFTVIFAIVTIFELIALGPKHFLRRGTGLFDALIVIENILNLSIYGFSVSGPFQVGMFWIRSFRPLMLMGRIDRLKEPLKALACELKTLWQIILAVFFIWIFFEAFAIHWLGGLYHKCIVRETGEELGFDFHNCLLANMTWENSDYHFDNPTDGFINMVFLVSRMGWVTIINGASDAVHLHQPRQPDVSRSWLVYFIAFVICGGLGAMGILFSHVFHTVSENPGLALTKTQLVRYTSEKSMNPDWIYLEADYIPSPTPINRKFIYNIVTNWKFDVVVMLLILFDNILLSLEHYNESMTFSHTLSRLRFLMLLLFILEMTLKLIAWGKHYFKSLWNISDACIVTIGLIDILVGIFSPHTAFATTIRLLRLLRIFRFLLGKTCGSTTVKIFFAAVHKARFALRNLALFQLTVMWSFAIFGTYLFGNVAGYGPLDETINFWTFSSSLSTLGLLLGFPCLDGLYSTLSDGQHCRQEGFTCGNKTQAVFYLGLYSGITFLVLMNMYVVLIIEIMSEFSKFTSNSKIQTGSRRNLEFNQ